MIVIVVNVDELQAFWKVEADAAAYRSSSGAPEPPYGLGSQDLYRHGVLVHASEAVVALQKLHTPRLSNAGQVQFPVGQAKDVSEVSAKRPRAMAFIRSPVATDATEHQLTLHGCC